MRKSATCGSAVVALIGALGFTSRADAFLIDFQTVNGSDPAQYVVGTTFVQGGQSITFAPFSVSEGTTNTTGRARRVGSGISLVDINYSLRLTNINVDIAIPLGGVTGLTVNHSLPGGLMNLIVNGDSAIVDAANLNGLTIGGVTLADVATGNTSDPALAGLLSFSGIVNSFSIGGASVTIDNVSATPAPTPGAIACFVAAGALGMTRRRR